MHCYNQSEIKFVKWLPQADKCNSLRDWRLAAVGSEPIIMNRRLASGRKEIFSTRNNTLKKLEDIMPSVYKKRVRGGSVRSQELEKRKKDTHPRRSGS